MKYLFLIIRHIFPRKKWEIINKTEVFEHEDDKMPIGYRLILRDQFGNIKVKKTY